MGYFDALTSSYFKTTSDGRRLFYPWGVMGRGYVIPTEPEYESLQGKLRTYTIVSMVVVIGVAVTLPVIVALAIAGGLIAFYLAWLPSLLRGLQPSDERLSVKDSMGGQARLHSAPVLWLMLLASLAFVAIGAVMLAVEPGQWLIAVFAIGFFGLCAGAFVWMLVLRRAGTDRPASH